MSVRSAGSSVTVQVSYTETHETFVRGRPSSVTVSSLPPYLFSFVGMDYKRHPSAVSWVWKRTDSFLRSLPESSVVKVRTDGKMYVSVPVTTKVDAKLITTESVSQTNVDSKVSIGTEVTRDVDGKVAFAIREVQRQVDSKLALSSGEVSLNVDGKLTFALSEVGISTDAKTISIHLSDLHWVNDFVNQLLPEVRSSSQVWMLPVRVSPRDRRIITLTSLPRKYAIVFGKGVLVHEHIGYWNYIGESGEEVPTVFQLTVDATMVRLINSTDREVFVVLVAYKP